jgi:hypothetical protein
MTSLSVATQLKDFPILIIIGVALIIGILGIIIKYFNKKSIAPRSNSSEQSSSSQSEDLISVKEDLLRKSPNSLTRTFLNANIKSNLNGGLPAGCN